MVIFMPGYLRHSLEQNILHRAKRTSQILQYQRFIENNIVHCLYDFNTIAVNDGVSFA